MGQMLIEEKRERIIKEQSVRLGSLFGQLS
jgi:hypothetical protein